MMPGENGLSLCRYISEHVGTPVILLTAAAEQADRVAGLEIGADDYVVKPFDPRELVARIRSVLRRSANDKPKHGRQDEDGDKGHIFCFSGWTLNVLTRELINHADHAVDISTAEFHLLRALVENPNRVLTRDQLLDLTQRHHAANFDRSVDSQVSRLRKKLEENPRHPKLVKTVRGDGYMLAADVVLKNK